eukprot:3184564-Pyramimonas_sp.AAC.1
MLVPSKFAQRQAGTNGNKKWRKKHDNSSSSSANGKLERSQQNFCVENGNIDFRVVAELRHQPSRTAEVISPREERLRRRMAYATNILPRVISSLSRRERCPFGLIWCQFLAACLTISTTMIRAIGQ